MTVLSASLSLHAFDREDGFGQHSTLSGSNACWLRRITSPWDEDLVTWDTQPGTTTDHQVALPASTAPDEDHLDIDVRQLVQDMVDDPLHGHGFELLLQTEEHDRMLTFWSGECPMAAKRPRLDVCYVCTTGIASAAPAVAPCRSIPIPPAITSPSYRPPVCRWTSSMPKDGGCARSVPPPPPSRRMACLQAPMWCTRDGHGPAGGHAVKRLTAAWDRHR